MACSWKVLSQFKPHEFCHLCKRNINDELIFGKIYQCTDIKVHYFCLLFCTHLKQNGKDTDGILGFLISDILLEFERNRTVECFYCKAFGAFCSCGSKRCYRNFHFPCGLENNSFHNFFGQFRSFCSEHRPKTTFVRLDSIADDVICIICQDHVKNAINPNNTEVVHATCCINTYFHKLCIQKMALSAGYFFKCPFCNNEKEFRQAMRRSGIYIPDQDAAWELTPNSFHELYEQYNSCDAFDCLCSLGRSFSSSSGYWSIIRCNTCGSQGIHVKCGKNIIQNKKEWICSVCSGVDVSANEANKENIGLNVNRNGCCSKRAEASAQKQQKIVNPTRRQLRTMKKRKYQSSDMKKPMRGMKKASRIVKDEKRIRCTIDGISVSILPNCKNQLKPLKVILNATRKLL